jgi:hypothetical protein
MSKPVDHLRRFRIAGEYLFAMVIVEEPLAETTWISTKSLDLLVKRGAVGTGVFDDHRGRTACGDNVNFN